jgi:hypothetical protein
MYLTVGVLGRTESSVGRRAALVKRAAHSGSLSEWVRPAGPRVSYAVAMRVEMEPQACARSCQFMLRARC